MIRNLLYLHNDPNHEKNTVLLQAKQLEVFSTETAEAACALFSHHPIHLILIDLELKEGNGLDFIEHLRVKGIFTPTIMAYANIDTSSILKSINLDIVQLLTKPYSKQNLYDALKVAMKKLIACHSLTYTDLNFGYSYDPINKHITSAEGETIKLCHKESLLIELLLENDEHITSYEMIENIVWQDSFMSIESLRTLIRGIRKKTNKNIITNHNGIGYKISIHA